MPDAIGGDVPQAAEPGVREAATPSPVLWQDRVCEPDEGEAATAKHGSGGGRGSQATVGKSIAVQAPVTPLGGLGDTREAFHELCIRTGRQVLPAVMEADREAVTGATGRHRGRASTGIGRCPLRAASPMAGSRPDANAVAGSLPTHADGALHAVRRIIIARSDGSM